MRRKNAVTSVYQKAEFNLAGFKKMLISNW
jgi:hypothetical protein